MTQNHSSCCLQKQKENRTKYKSQNWQTALRQLNRQELEKELKQEFTQPGLKYSHIPIRLSAHGEIFSKSNKNQIVFTILWLIWNQTDVRLIPNQSVLGKYNLISVWLYLQAWNIPTFPNAWAHTEKSLRIQTGIRLYSPCNDWFRTANGQSPFAVPIQSLHGKYNLVSVWFNRISKIFLCVRARIPAKKNWRQNAVPLCRHVETSHCNPSKRTHYHAVFEIKSTRWVNLLQLLTS